MVKGYVENVETVADEVVKNYNDQRSKPYEEVKHHHHLIKKLFEDKFKANANISRYWRIFNADRDVNHTYTGISQSYTPEVRAATSIICENVMASLFSDILKHVTVTSFEDAAVNNDITSLMEHYIKTSNLEAMCFSILKSGVVTGQVCAKVEWFVDKVKSNGTAIEFDDVTGESSIVDAEVVNVVQRPMLREIMVEDLVVYPATSSSINNAQIVCHRDYIHLEQLKEMIKTNHINNVNISDAERVYKNNSQIISSNEFAHILNRIKDNGMTEVSIGDVMPLYVEYFKCDGWSYIAYWTDSGVLLGIVKNPLDSKKIPIISYALEMTEGSFFGTSKYSTVDTLQYQLNDNTDKLQDFFHFNLYPVTKVDPTACPYYATLTYSPGVVWPVPPNAISQDPPTYVDSNLIVSIQQAKQEIKEKMGITELLAGTATQGRKTNALIGALERTGNTTVAGYSRKFELNFLTPLMQMWFELDCQYRDESITAVNLGSTGVLSSLKDISVFDTPDKFIIEWSGLNNASTMQRIQQQIAAVNVLQGIPPQLYAGYRLNLIPLIQNMVDSAFGVTQGAQVFINLEAEMQANPQAAMQYQAMMQQMQGGNMGGGGNPEAGAQPEVPRQEVNPTGMTHPDEVT